MSFTNGIILCFKLSPARITALMMGGFFLANSVGNKLSGILQVHGTIMKIK
jgi:POT family proton-dependent oligopeptide transporter